MIERVVTFGEAGRLVGTLCLPEGRQGDLGQVLFNAGIVHRVGPHRINVRLARRLARQGIASLRFDLSGLGDSGRAPGAMAFEEQAVRDLREAMDCLAAESAARRFALFGFCSGGRHSYAVAPLDGRVAGIVLYDTYAFLTPRARRNRLMIRIRQHGLLGAVMGKLRSIRNSRRDGGGAVQSGDGSYAVTPARDAFIDRVRSLLERGTAVGLMHSGEGDNFNYEAQFREAFAGSGLEDRVTLDYFPAMDHNAMDLGRQAAFIERLADWTVRLADRDAASPG